MTVGTSPLTVRQRYLTNYVHSAMMCSHIIAEFIVDGYYIVVHERGIMGKHNHYNWLVELNGITHQIQCDISGNTYVLYGDDDHIKTIYRKMFQNAMGGIDEGFELFGKPCRFVVQNEKPDIFFDGESLSDQIEYQHSIRKYHRTMRILNAIQCSIATIAIIAFIGLSIAGENMEHWVGAFIIAIPYAIVSFVGLLKNREGVKTKPISQ